MPRRPSRNRQQSGRRGPGVGGQRGAGEQRGITVSSIYVRADGNQLRNLAQQFADGQLQIPVAASYRLTDAAQALAQATGGHAAGAIALTP